MDRLQGIRNAINYIEDHICEKIDYEKVAKVAYASSCHFQRAFGITCGLTLGENIRRRGLTLAGNELLTEGAKVTDVAFRYGYDTPE